ncbi:hypothetical protein OS493_004341 [Desmophyllum pertusum]|uniref:Uncharacterized protein n=1 Tax=Desmophyllum pertusum TaxID=174260 RepID=A0A9W9ZTS7_9CNID|nr:hypothetical protein OS493_004341 [Desmophyllum pertusum]
MEKIEFKKGDGRFNCLFLSPQLTPLNTKMNQAIVKVLIMLALFTNTAHSGPLAYGICQTGCNFAWVTCVTAAGGVAGVSTGGVGVPAVILACNAAQGVCMAACIAAGFAPTL